MFFFFISFCPFLFFDTIYDYMLFTPSHLLSNIPFLFYAMAATLDQTQIGLGWVVDGGVVFNCLVCPSLSLLCLHLYTIMAVSFLSLSLVRWSIYWLFYEKKKIFFHCVHHPLKNSNSLYNTYLP